MEISVTKQVKYLTKITNKVGLIEHCRYAQPNYNEGWCVDDNARALQVGLRYGLPKKTVDIYFNFLKSAWRNEKFYNDLNRSLIWKEEFFVDGEHNGRALFALGEAIKNNYREDEVKNLFEKIYSWIKKSNINSLRMISQIILGLQFYKNEEIIFWANKLTEKYKKISNNDWKWFEETISYDNGRIPMALLIAYRTTKNKEYLRVGLESLDFLTGLIWDKSKNCFSFFGNNGWLRKDGFRAQFDQQPIEAGSMVETYTLAYKITKNKKYNDLAKKAFDWYLGRNVLDKTMIDIKTGGIFDGLEEKKVNKNRGAEAILSYLIAAKEIEKLKFD